MFNWFKKKEEESPPDEPNGKVEFCDPVSTTEEFNKSNQIEDFINRIKNKKNE